MLKRTPLYESHRALGARIVPFAGWEMPVSYSGVIQEHVAVRTTCGLFDVSHMGEVFVTGPGAIETLRLVACNDAARTVDGQCQYSLVLNDGGGVVDDVIIYRFDSRRFMICANASNSTKVFEWVAARARGARVEDMSSAYAELALQGPASVEVLRPLCSVDPSVLKRYHFTTAKVCGVESIVSRTGYTGEDGFEVYAPSALAPKLWGCILESGRPYGIQPAGLGARDTLRLEMGYPLYGHELDDATTPLEAGLGRFVALDGPFDFIGKAALMAAGPKPARALIGFELTEAGVPRQGYEVTMNGRRIGAVTSGTMSPMLKTGIGMAYSDAGPLEPGTRVEVMIRTRAAAAKVVKPPFYAKKKLAAVNAAV